MNKLEVKIGAVHLKNPLMPASGTFGFGREATSFMDPSILGAVVSKGLTVKPRIGNPPSRVCDTPSGMLNSVGLQNPGIEEFLSRELPFMQGLGTKIVVNAAGHCIEDYVALVERLEGQNFDAIELNLSCPNVTGGCMSIGADPVEIMRTVSAVRKLTDKPLWTKLTPNVSSIADCAKACEAAGADAVSLVNTFLGMSLDLAKRRPVLRNNTGGLSGPCIKPIAIRMVNDVYRAVEIPVVGLGGISSARDVLEFILAGAVAVQIGTAFLQNPLIFEEILRDLPKLMEQYRIDSLESFCGCLERWI